MAAAHALRPLVATLIIKALYDDQLPFWYSYRQTSGYIHFFDAFLTGSNRVIKNVNSCFRMRSSYKEMFGGSVCFENKMESLERLLQLEALEFLTTRRNRVIYEDRVCDLDILDSQDFKSKYRLSRSSAEHLLSLIGDKLSSTTSRNSALTPEEKLCIALRFFASGSHQQIIGDVNLISQASCCRAINDVAKCIAEMRPRFIYLPGNESERLEVSRKFFDIGGFPCVLGALDCSHIPIVSPGGSNPELFRNQKGFFSLNVQTLSDPDLYIRNIVARWPGSVDDSTIFDHSSLKAKFATGVIPPKYHLVGDNGYGCMTYLLTPFLNPRTRSERRYNFSHKKTRNVVERQHGLWKERFSCLLTKMRCSLDNTMTIIVATAVIHNIARSLGDFEEDEFFEADDLSLETYFAEDQVEGMAKREFLVQKYFS